MSSAEANSLQQLRASRVFKAPSQTFSFGVSRVPTPIASMAKSRSVTTLSSIPSYFSKIEQDLVNATRPLALPTSGSVQAGPYSGNQLNRQEELEFKGPRPIESYQINVDPNPEVIKKQLAPIKYTRQVDCKF
jgi:hypothetical protein